MPCTALIIILCFMLAQTSAFFNTLLHHHHCHNLIKVAGRKVSPSTSTRQWYMSSISTQDGSHHTDQIQKANREKKKKNTTQRPPLKAPLLRLDRILANRGVGSRTEVTSLIRRGKVSMDDETLEAEKRIILKSPSIHYPANTIFYVLDEEIRPFPLLLAYHKPMGVHSTVGDPRGRPNLQDVLPLEYSKTFHPVGRLDHDTTGLLLFSADGQLTQKLLHPTKKVSREYQASVEGVIDEQSLRHKLSEGVETADGVYRADVVEIEAPNIIRLKVAEGKHRMVRRMLANCGHPVLSLHRYKYGEIELDFEEGKLIEIEEGSPEDQWAKELLLS